MEVKQRRRRKDSIDNEAKVMKAIIKNPLKTQDEIAKETGISKTTVHNKLNNLKQDAIKAPSIEEICKKDIESVKLGQDILLNRLKNTPDELRVREIVDITAESTKRYTLFKGKATDEFGGLNSLNELPIEDLWRRLKALNDKESNGTNGSGENGEGDN